jgi:hypothetical protein
MAIHHRVHFPLSLLWAFSFWGLAHMMGGTYHVPGTNEVLYNYWLIPDLLRYDQLIHAYGFGISAFACWLGLKAMQPGIRPTAGPLSLSLLASLGLGALNETIEFSLTLFLSETNVGGFNNLGWDLIFNLLGALIAVSLIRILTPSENAASPKHIQREDNSKTSSRERLIRYLKQDKEN